MADVDSAPAPTPIPTALNVTALAKRLGVSRRTIQRRLSKGWTPDVVAPKQPKRVRQVSHSDVAPDAAPAAPTRTVAAATLTAALALATCSAAFSISGLTSIFAGAFWAVIGLGVAFELGKLSAAAGSASVAAPGRYASPASPWWQCSCG